MNPTSLRPKGAPRRAAALALTAGVLSSLWSLGAPAPAAAGIPPPTVITVNTTDDLLDLDVLTVSLREAFNAAAGPDLSYEIVLQEDAEYVLDRCNGGTDELNNVGGDLDLNGEASVTLQGNGATIRQTCNGERVVQVTTPDVYFQIYDVTITGGRTASTGGGIWANGTLAVYDSTVEGNVSTGANGGGGVAASLELGLTRTLVTGNTSAGEGGGVRTNEFLILNSSTIAGNHSATHGGGASSGTSAYVRDSTVTGNSAQGNGGGIRVADDADIEGSTLVANRAPAGANAAAGGALGLHGSVIALGSGGPDCLSVDPIITAGGNVGQDTSCGAAGADDIARVHPQVGLLADNGGGTPTMAPVTGSPAVDRYNPACATNADQRGTARPQGAACDSGSVEGAPAACAPTFPDVGAGHAFFEEICWLSQTGITGGFPDGTFKPNQDVSRQAMAAFLYRLALAPPPPATGPTFSDVPAEHAFSQEIEWLNAEGISTGYGDGTFRPDDAVTRQAMAAFLHRVAGTPVIMVGPPTFSDVPVGHGFFVAIEWMAQSGVSTGFADGTFRPDQTVTRQAMAAFLQRLAADVLLLGL